MFYRAANGATYTQLTHSYQRYVDLSDHLTNGCAILCGRSNQRATQLVIDGGSTPTQYDRHWTWYRILFPVRSSSPTDRSAESAPSSARAVLLANHLPHKVPAP
jgi:hypothetical protein